MIYDQARALAYFDDASTSRSLDCGIGTGRRVAPRVRRYSVNVVKPIETRAISGQSNCIGG